MRFTIVSIFPEFFDSFLSCGLMAKAVEAGVVAVDRVNPRDFATDRHHTVDDRPYGGGPGMDVHFTSIQMKKNRPGTCISLLCAVAEEERFKDLLFRHTTTSGVKSFPLEKTELERSFARLETPLGPVTMKNTLRDGKVLRAKPEFEDCRAMATCHNIPLAEVYACIARSSKEYVP